jgi:hypothetical protein
MIAFSSSSVSLSPKNRPFAASTTMVRTSRRFKATAGFPHEPQTDSRSAKLAMACSSVG